MMVLKKSFLNSVLLLLLLFLSGCSLTDAFINVIDGDQSDLETEQSYFGQDGDSFDFSDQGYSLQDYLFSNMFIKDEKNVTDTINIEQNQFERAYFFYFNDNSQDNVKLTYEINELLKPEADHSYSYTYRYQRVVIDDNISFFTVTTKQKPNHKSNYFFNTVIPIQDVHNQCGNDLYVFCSNAFGKGGFSDRSKIKEDERKIHIPTNAKIARFSTSLDDYDVIGIARNGILLMQESPKDKLTYFDLKYKLDEYYAAPDYVAEGDPKGYYYYVEPTYFTGYQDFNYFNEYDYEFHENSSRYSLIGLARDGFPIYGPFEYKDERIPTNLDACRGHIGETGDRFTNTYHYHVKPIDHIKEGDKNLFIECFSGTPVDNIIGI